MLRRTIFVIAALGSACATTDGSSPMGGGAGDGGDGGTAGSTHDGGDDGGSGSDDGGSGDGGTGETGDGGNENELPPGDGPDLEIHANLETLHAVWQPPEGASDAATTLWYRARFGPPDWIEAHPLVFDDRGSQQWQTASEYRGPIVSLEPETTYQIKVELTHGLGTRTAYAEGTTDTLTGNLAVAQTIEVQSGNTPFVIDGLTNPGGSASAWVKYVPAPGGGVIDVGDAHDSCLTLSVPYVIIEGLVLQDCGTTGAEVLPGAHHIRFERNTVRLWGQLEPGTSWAAGKAAGFGNPSYDASGNGSISDIKVRGNVFENPRYTSNYWSEHNGDSYHPRGAQPILMPYPGQRWEISYNTIRADNGNAFNDGMGSPANFKYNNWPPAFSDIHHNDIAAIADDAIEADGGGRSAVIRHNRIRDSWNAVSVQPTAVGPIFIWRNYAEKLWEDPTFYRPGQFLKAQNKGVDLGYGRTFLYNNTMIPEGDTGGRYGVTNFQSEQFSLLTTRNNVFRTTTYRGPKGVVLSDGVDNDFDYDVMPESNDFAGDPDPEPNGMFYTDPGQIQYADRDRLLLDSGSLGHQSCQEIPNFAPSSDGDPPDCGAGDRDDPDVILTGHEHFPG